jgi:hypothetical protein
LSNNWWVNPESRVISVISVFLNTPLSGAAFFLFMAINVYLDESGDLGWKFTAPFRNGGSSRFMTIAFVICPSEKKHLLKRVVVKLYTRLKTNPKKEIKGSSLSLADKEFVARNTIKLLQLHPDIKIVYITVKKENVKPHIQADNNLIYNYMMRLALLKEVDQYPVINLIRDNKSVKIKSGNTLINYLQTELYFSHGSSSKLIDIPSDSKSVQNLIFIDWVNNIIWGHYEDENSSPYNILRTHIHSNQLFFQ